MQLVLVLVIIPQVACVYGRKTRKVKIERVEMCRDVREAVGAVVEVKEKYLSHVASLSETYQTRRGRRDVVGEEKEEEE